MSMNRRGPIDARKPFSEVVSACGTFQYEIEKHQTFTYTVAIQVALR